MTSTRESLFAYRQNGYILMKKDKKNVVLYEGMSIPLWLLMFMPRAWLFILPALFLLCSAVLIALFCHYEREQAHGRGSLKGLGKDEIKDAAAKWRKCIVPTLLFSFLARVLCSGTIMLIAYIPGVATGEDSWWSRHVTSPASANPFASFPAFLLTVCCIAFTAYIIYWLCFRIAFRRLPYDEDGICSLAKRFALFTAPYLLLLPSEWFWK